MSKRGSIESARGICVDICGPIDGEDFDGNGYGSVDIAEILSGAYDALKLERDELVEAARGMVSAVDRNINTLTPIDILTATRALAALLPEEQDT